MTSTRTIAPRILVLVGVAALAFAACGDDDSDPATSTDAPEETTASTAPTATEPDATTTTAEQPGPSGLWEGDAEAAVEAVQSHLDTVHPGAAYYDRLTGVSVNEANGVAAIETSLSDETDAVDLAVTLCTDAAMVAYGDPANLNGLDVLDGNGNVLALGAAGGSCTAA